MGHLMNSEQDSLPGSMVCKSKGGTEGDLSQYI
jgi:hypothetical protein